MEGRIVMLNAVKYPAGVQRLIKKHNTEGSVHW